LTAVRSRSTIFRHRVGAVRDDRHFADARPSHAVRGFSWLVLLAALIAPPAAAGAQDESPAARNTLRIFLDCGRCDFDYLRREVEFVDYVRDRKDAEVHILVTTQSTGSGGLEWVFQFIGLQRFQGVDDELRYTSLQNDTADDRRQGYTRVLKLGLVRYVTSTALADNLQLVYRPPAQTPEGTAAAAVDPWNYWIFRVRGSGSVNGEQSNSSRNLSTSASANRTTEMWKISGSVNLNYRSNLFTLSDGEELTDRTHDHSAGTMIVRSLGPHWAAAVRARVSSSTFVNQDRAIRVAGGLEYNVFPYAESSRRQLVTQVTIAVTSFDYAATTIYGKDSETAGSAILLSSFDVRQPWGSSGLSLEVSSYFHDPARHRIAMNGDIDVRLFRGLSLNMYAGVSRIRDQLYLQAGDATDEEILLRRRQLATSYRYRFSVGLTYTFGSIFNNVVNPRFREGG
jgi:hypothetical protein